MAIESKYGRLTTERKQIPDDEPVFLLRAQDVLAPIVVRHYAELWEATHPGLQGRNGAERIRAIAEQMAAWPNRKVPD